MSTIKILYNIVSFDIAMLRIEYLLELYWIACITCYSKSLCVSRQSQHKFWRSGNIPFSIFISFCLDCQFIDSVLNLILLIQVFSFAHWHIILFWIIHLPLFVCRSIRDCVLYGAPGNSRFFCCMRWTQMSILQAMQLERIGLLQYNKYNVLVNR